MTDLILIDRKQLLKVINKVIDETRSLMDFCVHFLTFSFGGVPFDQNGTAFI
jgi:hypothetical protein